MCASGPRAGVPRRVAELIEDDGVHAREASGDAPGASLGVLLLKQVDEIGGRVEPRSLAVPGDARPGARGCQMALPSPVPPRNTALCASSVNAIVVSCSTSLRSTTLFWHREPMVRGIGEHIGPQAIQEEMRLGHATDVGRRAAGDVKLAAFAPPLRR